MTASKKVRHVILISYSFPFPLSLSYNRDRERGIPVGVLGPTAHPGLPLNVFSRSRTVSTTVAKWFVLIARETVDKILQVRAA
jgi:hypothetical protein